MNWVFNVNMREAINGWWQDRRSFHMNKLITNAVKMIWNLDQHINDETTASNLCYDLAYNREQPKAWWCKAKRTLLRWEKKARKDRNDSHFTMRSMEMQKCFLKAINQNFLLEKKAAQLHNRSITIIFLS